MKTTGLLTVFLIFFIHIAAHPLPITIDDGFKYAAIGTDIDYLEDRRGTLGIGDVIVTPPDHKRWQRSNQDVPGFGFTDSVYWVRFTLKNGARKPVELYLRQKYPLIDYCTLYIPEAKGLREIKTGDFLPFSSRPVAYRDFIFPLAVPAGSEATCYMRFATTSSMTISLDLLSRDYFEYLKDRESIFLWAFYGFLILMFIYNLFILISSRDISNLYYILFILFFLIFIMGQNGTAMEYLWPDSPWWANYSIPFTLGMLDFSVILFLRRFIMIGQFSKAIDRLTLALALITAAAGVASLAIGRYRISMQVTAILSLAMIAYCLPIMAFLAFIKKSRQAMFTLFAFIFFLLGALLYILKAFSIIPENQLTMYGLQLGSTIQIVLLSLGMQDKVNIMRLNLMKAENKYRTLVDGSSDIIFSLDERLDFITVNRSIRTHLGFKEEDIAGKNLTDIMYRDEGDKLKLDENILDEYVSDLMKNKSAVSFRTSLVTRHTREPKEFTLKLEYTETAGRVEILGKAIVALDDSILKFMDSEKHRYRINNFISNADILSYRLTRNLEKHLDQADITAVRICLRETIINAIEHGSLGITFEEKSEALIRGDYLEFLNDRLRDSAYADREVAVDYALDGRSASYRITDQGGGFDYQRYLGRLDRANDEMLPHGRGLSMALQEFDVVEFNSTGNRILLVKYFGNGARRVPLFIEEDEGA